MLSVQNEGTSMRDTAGTLTVYNTVADVGVERWDALARACDAPVFYRSAFLSAFERFPLHATTDRFYLVAEDGNGALRLAMPMYTLQSIDPMRILATHFPAEANAPLLLNHVWHCYDTWLLARPLDADTVRLALDAMRDFARVVGAAVWGFSNVEAGGPLARALDAANIQGRDVEERYFADLAEWPDVTAYLASLHRSSRSNMTRTARFARDAGVITAIVDVDTADLDGFVVLARANAEKYQNADYYRPGLFQPFVRALGRSACIIEQRLDGRLIGSGILLLDDTRLHFWLSGNDYDAVPHVSPFYLCFLTAVQAAIASGKRWFEGGRRNPTFKLRYGLRPRTIRAYLTPS